MNPVKTWYAQATNPRNLKGGILDVIRGANLFIGLSGPGTLPVKGLKRMARDAIVFAMANPVPEIMPEEAARHVRVMATGRSDYPNQINNSSCFPGFFRGLLDSRASHVNDAMKIAAAKAIAGLVNPRELNEEYITPSMFDARVAPAVAAAVAEAAYKTGAARRARKPVGGFRPV
jgi:malate dehydrogenase (oxaloacetate-decarboxylating)